VSATETKPATPPPAGDKTDNGAAKAADQPPVPAAIARAVKEEKVYSDALDALRKRSDLAAKAIGGVGTSVIGALGVATLTDIWPPGEPWWAVTLLIAGFVLMAVGVIGFAMRIWKAQQPFVIGSGDEGSDLDEDERLLAGRISDEVAHFRDVESLHAYQARGERFERVAIRLKPTQAELAARVLERSAVILAEVSEARMKTVYAVVRHRATKAFRSVWSGAFVALVALGFYLVGVAADRLDSERTGKIEFAKNCASALGTTNIDESDLPAQCQTGAPANPEPNPGSGG
jgi:hypothetical protein